MAKAHMPQVTYSSNLRKWKGSSSEGSTLPIGWLVCNPIHQGEKATSNGSKGFRLKGRKPGPPKRKSNFHSNCRKRGSYQRTQTQKAVITAQDFSSPLHKSKNEDKDYL